MSAQPQNLPELNPHRPRRGFTLLEVALAVLVLLLSLVFALTVAGRVRQRRNCDNYIRDLRIFSAAFAGYYQQHKSWPPSSSAESALPPDLARTLRATPWFAGSRFGGNYGWIAPDPAAGRGPGHAWGDRGALTLTAFSPRPPLTLSAADLLYIDRQLDDANLATGRFRTGFNGWPVYLVEAAPR